MSAQSLATPAAHLSCAALLAVDALARAIRLQRCVRAYGGEVGLAHALGANLVEDAGAAVTPLRLGGQPARLAMLSRAGVRVRAAILASIAEAAITYPLVIVAMAIVALAFAPDWWRTVSPGFGSALVGAWPWLAAGTALGIVSWITMQRVLPRQQESASEALGEAWRELRRLDRDTLVIASLTTLVSIAARVAILPVLTQTLDQAPAVGLVTLSSFVLLYGQLLLPTPSGAGAVESGFLAGGAGVAGAHTASLLLTWRVYTSLLSIVAGLSVAAEPIIRTALRRRVLGAPSRSTTPSTDQ